MSARWPSKTSLIYIPYSTTIIWHPSSDKRAFVRALGSSQEIVKSQCNPRPRQSLTEVADSLTVVPTADLETALSPCELSQSPVLFCFLNLFIYLFIYLFNVWLHWVFVPARRLSLVAVNGGYSSLRCVDFSLRWLLLLQRTGSRHMGFSSCGTWAQQLLLTGSRAQAQYLWHTGLVAP